MKYSNINNFKGMRGKQLRNKIFPLMGRNNRSNLEIPNFHLSGMICEAIIPKYCIIIRISGINGRLIWKIGVFNSRNYYLKVQPKIKIS